MYKLGGKLVRLRSKALAVTKKYGPTPGYHRLDKLPRIATVIDVGVGHNGSAFLYKRFPDAFFISIDPLREAQEAVNRHLGRNNNHFILAAVGMTKKIIEFHVSRTPSRTSLLQRTRHDDHSTPTETRHAQMDRLDNLLQDFEMDRPVLLKVDIEGYELDCLKSGDETVKKVDYIILELPLTNNFQETYHFSQVIAFLGERKFEPFQVLKAGNNNIDFLFCRVDDPLRTKWAYGVAME